MEKLRNHIWLKKSDVKKIEMEGELKNPKGFRSKYTLQTECGQVELDEMCKKRGLQIGAGEIPVYMRTIHGSIN